MKRAGQILWLALILALSLGTPLRAVQPDEILDDPVLEARARELSKGLRCLVCRNQSIDDSNADLAKDLRLLVRERLVRQQLATMQELIGQRLANAGGDAKATAGLQAVSQAIKAVEASTDQRLDLEWRAALDGLGENRALAEELAQQANDQTDASAADAEVIAFIVDRYGEYVLLKPTATGANLILWIAGPVMLLLALGGAFFYLRRRQDAGGPEPLSDGERAELDEILES